MNAMLVSGAAASAPCCARIQTVIPCSTVPSEHFTRLTVRAPCASIGRRKIVTATAQNDAAPRQTRTPAASDRVDGFVAIAVQLTLQRTCYGDLIVWNPKSWSPVWWRNGAGRQMTAYPTWPIAQLKQDETCPLAPLHDGQSMGPFCRM